MTGGSSPLARGLRIQFGPFMLERGIIPARAGFTARAGSPTDAARDHPRSRGVYCRAWGIANVLVGSSPLARGLRWTVKGARRPRGIIPARAGFTARRRRCASACGDHPRSRGVYPTSCQIVRSKWGSSPLARGLHFRAQRVRVHGRIIPARAGFTCAEGARGPPSQDHPRSRGVYPRSGATPGPSEGSSPLARGLPGRPAAPARALGIIPARAGFTSTIPGRT